MFYFSSSKTIHLDDHQDISNLQVHSTKGTTEIIFEKPANPSDVGEDIDFTKEDGVHVFVAGHEVNSEDEFVFLPEKIVLDEPDDVFDLGVRSSISRKGRVKFQKTKKGGKI